MKQLSALIILMLFVFIFFGCSETDKPGTPEYFGNKNMSFDDYKFSEIYEKSEHYIIYVCEYPQNDPYNKFYWYEILDNAKTVILNGGTEWKIPIITEDENIVSVELDYGTLADIYRYYDTETNILSDVYTHILARNHSLICYFEKDELVIRDIFDKTLFYQTVKRDYDDRAVPIEEIKFIDEDSIEVSYYTKNNTVAVEKINLENQSGDGSLIDS